ncbi:hypothetical protein CPT_Minot_048 [Acinetobacter phage Minot]|nr:hypothetical protein CPT_Minot_048 [Acinetobacter phage Minot]QQO96500.1 hypothetical protein CPT_Mokit_049 [Acinetobacter phage Mokit]
MLNSRLLEEKLRIKARTIRVARLQVKAQIRERQSLLEFVTNMHYGRMAERDYSAAKILDRKRIKIQKQIQSLDKIDYHLAREQINFGLVIQRVTTFNGQYGSSKVFAEKWSQVLSAALEQLTVEIPYRFRHYTFNQGW